MVAMKNMRLAKQEKGETDTMVSRPDGVPVRLEHEHIVKMGLDAPLPHGTKLEFGGHGEVTDSGTHEMDGEPRHHMTVMLHRAGIEPNETAADKRDSIRGDIEEAADSVVKKDTGAGDRARLAERDASALKAARNHA